MTYALARVFRKVATSPGPCAHAERNPLVVATSTASRPIQPLVGLKIAMFALMLSAVWQPANAEGNAEQGRDKAYTCMGCHAAPGIRNAYPSFNVPKLAGQQMEYIVAALTAYQNKTRKHPTMQANAADMSAEDMADVAAYFANMSK